MGRFAVDVEITNYDDLVRVKDGSLKPGGVRRKTIQGVVDSGAAKMVLPETLVKALGLPIWKSKTKVKYGDGRRGLRNEVGSVHVQLQ